ncbi:MAG: zinc ribbon domain-containing protein [Chloroflexota bacterium]
MYERKIYHGDITPNEIARALVAEFNHGNLQAQQLGREDQVIVQIASRLGATSGGQTALTVTLQEIEDGVSVQIGKQAWFGVAASLGVTALAALRNPFTLIHRLDDLAQDIEHLGLTDRVCQVIEETVHASGAGLELSERLQRVVCEYCRTANQLGEDRCIACGAPLGDAHPTTCPSCGFVIVANEDACPNCGKNIG